MKDGLYSVVFTTNSGTLAEGAVLINGSRLVGADFLHAHNGTVSQADDAFEVAMHCRRHADASPLLGLPDEFDLHWRGTDTAYGFVAEAKVPASDIVLLATARHIETD